LFRKSKLTHGLTAFLDILGFTVQVKDAEPGSNVEGLVGSIRLIRKAFGHGARDSSTKAIHLAYGKSVLAFSDCVIVNVPLVSRMTELQGEFDALMSELHSMALAQATCIEHALFLRGGVDLGWWYRDGTTLVSRSLANAYALEGTASVPVIALTDQLYSFLARHTERLAYSEDYDPLPAMIRRFSGFVAGKQISIRYLDYLSILAREIDWTPTPAYKNALLSLPEEQRDAQKDAWRLENLRYWFAGHARTVELAHSRVDEPHIRAKYEWLAEYHNEVAPGFSEGDPSCVCVV
jgi:hypothetical protein